MIRLIPDWARNYDEYLNSVRLRNIWLIHLRYAAVIMLTALIVISEYILKLEFTKIQVSTLSFVTFVILLYNVLLQRIRKYLDWSELKFNPLHLSLIQIILDLFSLIVIVYITGSIETPLYILFIFHMVIGSLILPKRIILVIATVLVILFSSIVLGEYYSLIPHHHIAKIHSGEYAGNINFILTSLVIFIFTIYTTVLLTSEMAKRLYNREQQLKESLEKINELEITKQTYIMGVVHEIKSPIVASQSIVELIKNGYLGTVNESIKNKLERVISRNEEALNLINNILRISKLKLTDRIPIERIKINEFIKNIIEQKSDNIKSKECKIDFKSEVNDNLQIDGDKILFELIFSNVIGNAVKYINDNGKIVINIAKKVDFIQLEIIDNGIGIPGDEIKMIFNQFYRASNLRSKIIDGSGLGLSLVKEIITRFNGDIKIESPSGLGDEKNPGTKVIIILPIKQS